MKIKYFAASIIAAICSLLPTNARADYYEQLGMEGVDMMMALKYCLIDANDYIYATEGFYRLTHDALYQPDFNHVLKPALASGGACYHDGKIYSCEYQDFERVDKETPKWRIYDAKTFALLSENTLPDYCRATTTGLTYDVTEDMIYGFNITYTETFFVKVDPQTGEMTRIGDMLDRNCKYLGLACRKDGMIYCVYMDKTTSTHYLARIRKSDGRIATIGVLSCGGYMDGDPFVNGGYAQCLWFDNSTDELYWIHQSASNYLNPEDYTPMMKIDVAKSSATMVAYFPKHILSAGIFFLEPKFTAPAIVSDFSYNPTSPDRETGTLTMVAPSTDYIGRQLTANVTVNVYLNGLRIFQSTVAPGAAITVPERHYTLGNNTVTINVTNADGEEGPTITRKFYAGFDTPKAPRNIRLTADGLTTTVTWDAPNEGVHGEMIMPETFTYTVVRYPGEVIVAEGLTDLQFVETHPGDMTRYLYMVTAVDQVGRQGQTGMSNNLIVGTPLVPPYGGYFEDAFQFFNYYTILDSNADTSTWTYAIDNMSAIYMFSETNDADDWLISPPIMLEKGSVYKLSFSGFSSMVDYPEAVDVHFGTGRTPDQLPTQLLSIAEVPGIDENSDEPVKSWEVTIPKITETGVYHYAFHCVSPAFCEYLYLFNILIERDADASVGVVDVDQTAITISSVGHGLSIENPMGQRVSIYTPSGLMINQSSARDYNVNLPTGLYIVKAANKAYKVIVK